MSKQNNGGILKGYIEPKMPECKPPRKQINFDRIKNMTVEELAEFMTNPNCCTHCNLKTDDWCERDLNVDCKIGIKLWLESEVTNENFKNFEKNNNG